MQRLSTAQEDTLHGWVQAMLPGLTVIWADQDGERPELPFATLDIIAGPRSTGPAEERWHADDQFAYPMRKRATLSIQVHAVNTLVLAAQVENALQLPTHQARWRVGGFGVWGNEPARDITALMDTRHEPRAVIDVFIAWADEAIDTPGEIRKVRTVGAADGVITDQTTEVQ